MKQFGDGVGFGFDTARYLRGYCYELEVLIFAQHSKTLFGGVE